jgi:hypothetical protein
MKYIRFLAALAFAAPAAAAQRPVEVMIVGGFHMGNPGRDLHNAEVPDVLTPNFQSRIAEVDRALATFRPTLVAAEWDQATVAQRYPDYLRGALPPTRNEVVQLGFRLAKATSAAMHGIDLEGDFPYEAVAEYAKAHGQTAILDDAGASVQAMVDTMTRMVARGDVAGALRFLNDPHRLKDDNAFYRAMLRIGGGAEQPGADLLTQWYRRNFLICANLIQISKPGDRVVVFYGSGHAFLLRQCVSETPGFVLVEPNDWLPR